MKTKEETISPEAAEEAVKAAVIDANETLKASGSTDGAAKGSATRKSVTAEAASAKAHDASFKAHATGEDEYHAKAKAAHESASDAHSDAMMAHAKVGNVEEAKDHAKAMTAHDACADSHCKGDGDMDEDNIVSSNSHLCSVLGIESKITAGGPGSGPRKTGTYKVRPSHYGGKWIAESPTGIATQHDSKEEAVAHAQKHSDKIEYTMPASDASVSEAIRCRDNGAKITAANPWEIGKPAQFMYMPGGISTITAGFRDKAINITVECDEDTPKTLQASYDNLVKRSPKQQPFGCVEHREQEATVRTASFGWGTYDGDSGALITTEPTKLGADNVNGKIHRSWSPSFATDADYSKATEKGGVYTFPEGVRGSTSNPARITGIDFCFGTLTNKPAFKNMPPVKAKAATGRGEVVKATSETVFARLAQPTKLDAVFTKLRARAISVTPTVPVKKAATTSDIFARLSKQVAR